MPKVAKFNPYLLLTPKVKPVAPDRSWWLDVRDRRQWMTTATTEAPRMSATPEARLVNPRCLDDIRQLF